MDASGLPQYADVTSRGRGYARQAAAESSASHLHDRSSLSQSAFLDTSRHSQPGLSPPRSAQQFNSSFDGLSRPGGGGLNHSNVSGMADLGTAFKQSAGVARDGSAGQPHGGARPKTSPPGRRSAFTPVTSKAQSGGNNTYDHQPGGGEQGSSQARRQPSIDDSSVTSSDGGGMMTSGAGGYAPHPLQYATYDAGLNTVGGSAEKTPVPNGGGNAPQSTRSERHVRPANHHQAPANRGAYTDVTKDGYQQQYGAPAYPLPARHARSQPKKLDFNSDQAVNFNHGPHVSSQDTCI